MSLRIIPSSEAIRIERINVALYGAPGCGKTSMAFTAAAPLLLDFDNGAHRAANRKDSVRVTSWEDVASMKAGDLEAYKTVVVDTAGRALDSLTADIIRRNPKAGRGGALTLQGYGTLKAEFVAWLKALNAFGKDVVLIAHMDEQRNGDELIERLDVQGGSKGEIYKAADAMGRVSIKDGARTLNFNPTEAAFGKNPGQLDPIVIPHPDREPEFLAGIMQKIKDRLNALTAEQTAAATAVEAWREKIVALQSLEAFNREMPSLKGQPKAVKSMFETAAATHGYIFDRELMRFRLAVPAKEEKPSPTYGDDAPPVVDEPSAPGATQPVEQEALL